MPENLSNFSPQQKQSAQAPGARRNIQRLVAKKVQIAEIANGRFYPGSREEMKASYIISPLGMKFSRGNIIGTVVDKFVAENEAHGSLTIDDGSSAVRVRVFRDGVKMLQGVEVGNLVLVVGKVKKYNDEIYVTAEVVRAVEANYENLRRLEVLQRLIEQKKVVEGIRTAAEKMSQEELESYANEFGIDAEALEVIGQQKDVDYKPKIAELIEEMDSGDGVEITTLFEVSKLPEHIIERAIDELLAAGEIYEPTAGKLKRIKSQS